MVFKKGQGVTIVLVLLLCVFQIHAQTLKRKALFNLGWKFIASSPAGAQATSFNDTSWQSVSIPHSASYDAPYYNSENKHFQGTCWYRKHFTCPATAQKVFMHFEGAMQTCDLFVNGDSIGSHSHSGYTAFNFDISNALIRGGSNVVAIRLNNTYSTSIPPGGTGTSGTPDYFIFSGLYRNVWLLFKDSVYIPDWGQRIYTPGSTASAAVRAQTVVANATAAAKSAAVTITLFDATGVSVTTATSTQSIPAASSTNFDITTPTITPQLWSPSTPNMYSLQTIVKVGGAVVDSIVQPVGFRWFSWSTTNGFSLNGSRIEMQGMAMHQNMGWIENALPDSRFYQQVKLMKAMGMNAVRCSHYPRAQAFYDACDKLGLLVWCELPTWMTLTTTFPQAFWTNLDSCVHEMVLDGFNHPCIYAWGIANEPQQTSFFPYFDTLVGLVHGIDSMSLTGRGAAYNHLSTNQEYAGVDILGLNYSEDLSGFTVTKTLPFVNTESYGNWGRVYPRGGTMDIGNPVPSTPTAGTEATNEVNNMSFVTGTTSGACAGGHFWLFNDYNSWHSPTGLQGVVDRFYVPKNSYFLFRKTWAGTAPDYPISGTPTMINLVADTANLLANGSDVAIIVANLRNAAGACIAQACNITWTVSPAGMATLFPGTGTSYSLTATQITDSALGGRATLLLRTTTTPGTITVIATSSCGLPADTITLTSNPATESYVATPVSVHQGLIQQTRGATSRLRAVYADGGVTLPFPEGGQKVVQIINIQGKTLASYVLRNGTSIFISHKVIGRGLCFAAWSDNGHRMLTTLHFIQ